MSMIFTPTRRTFIKSAAALAGATALTGLGVGAASAAGLTVGFIYVGPKDDYGYNQAHAEGHGQGQMAQFGHVLVLVYFIDNGPCYKVKTGPQSLSSLANVSFSEPKNLVRN